MGKVYVFGGFMVVLGLVGLYVLVFSKVAQKMFSNKKKEISK
jgi:hypothetical protein